MHRHNFFQSALFFLINPMILFFCIKMWQFMCKLKNKYQKNKIVKIEHHISTSGTQTFFLQSAVYFPSNTMIFFLFFPKKNMPICVQSKKI